MATIAQAAVRTHVFNKVPFKFLCMLIRPQGEMHLDGDVNNKKEIKSVIRQCNDVDGDKIIKELSKLKKDNYRKSLSAEEGFEAKNDAIIQIQLALKMV